MIGKAKYIDSAFRNIRSFSITFIFCCATICMWSLWLNKKQIDKLNGRVYVIANGKLLDAVAIDRADSIAIEIRDHVKMFHYYFFNLAPEDQAIQESIAKALYLADGSAKRVYDDYAESGYYNNLISGKINQQVMDYDSILIDLDHLPISFRYYGKEIITRSTNKVTRSLITQGIIMFSKISDKNPHGFLIEKWRVIENLDLKPENKGNDTENKNMDR